MTALHHGRCADSWHKASMLLMHSGHFAAISV
jgi:hypothetical protein